MSATLSIRLAQRADAKDLLKIYEPYVTGTAITFEYEVPSVSEFADRISNTLKRYPYLVAVEAGQIIGYAYASPFKSRAAYDWAVETTVYLDVNVRGKGFGKQLYLALEDALKKQNIINLYACIAYASSSDAHLSNASAIFHEHLGYTQVGYFTKCGYKFDTWYDMIWMEKMLNEHSANPPVLLPVTAIF
ncbi:N-acetyltransferase [Aminipila butyrica]|uniref:N-acetyltransferase n=1 Tax=Aminipila butyrica TaxID=433296 RepID=A0A858BU24_9FIRM|nr:GNAT family N-acetyltransferase [Aminipila butyrica]QIB69067.1 N-acetyltransferase [Aminipila butyrica]